MAVSLYVKWGSYGVLLTFLQSTSECEVPGNAIGTQKIEPVVAVIIIIITLAKGFHNYSIEEELIPQCVKCHL